MKEITLPQITKTAWILIAIAFFISLLTLNLSIISGVVIGSLLGLLNFKLLSLTTKKALNCALSNPYIFTSYIVRLTLLGLILALILSIKAINSIAVLVGLSMIIGAIMIKGIINTFLVFRSDS
ncbi:MAG: ATP synthase subunit I [bacterium]